MHIAKQPHDCVSGTVWNGACLCFTQFGQSLSVTQRWIEFKRKQSFLTQSILCTTRWTCIEEQCIKANATGTDVSIFQNIYDTIILFFTLQFE